MNQDVDPADRDPSAAQEVKFTVRVTRRPVVAEAVTAGDKHADSGSGSHGGKEGKDSAKEGEAASAVSAAAASAAFAESAPEYETVLRVAKVRYPRHFAIACGSLLTP